MLSVPVLPARSVKTGISTILTTLPLASLPGVGVKVALHWVWSLLGVNAPRLPFCTLTLLLSKAFTASLRVTVTCELLSRPTVSWLMTTETTFGAAVSTRQFTLLSTSSNTIKAAVPPVLVRVQPLRLRLSPTMLMPWESLSPFWMVYLNSSMLSLEPVTSQVACTRVSPILSVSVGKPLLSLAALACGWGLALSAALAGTALSLKTSLRVTLMMTVSPAVRVWF